MVVARSFSEKDLCAMSQNTKHWFTLNILHKQEYHFVAYWSKKYKLQFLAVKEDDSEWSTRSWTAQVSFQRFQVSYLTTVPPTVFLFTYSYTVRVTVSLLIVFFLFFMVSFQVPLISCASPWRAGETKNGAFPKFWLVYSSRLVHVLYCFRVS